MAVTAAAVLTSGGGALAGETLETTELPAGRYIVQVAGEPVASYDGGVSGFSATQPDDGEKIDDGSGAVVRYRDYLAGLRGEVIGEVPGIAPVRQFDTVLNGFTADLSAEQAERLSREPGVLGLWPDAEVHLDTSNTPGFLGLAGDGGVWEEQYGGDEHAGEGVIVGVLDSGFWPETPSFGPLPEPRPDQDVIDAKWSGECMTGEGAGAVTCNNKVIGARYYPDGAAILPTDYLSPRDHHGHGSHTSSTAAGNHGVDAGPVFGSLSGMAPAARLAIYKICWRNTTGGCPARTTNVVSAIEDSVNDGVDVINYSFGSTGDITAFDPIHLAYFNAAAAGVFVATSAGNSGPAASTVGHNTPWMTTVAASTYDKAYLAKVTLGNGTTVTGAGIGTALPSTAVISSEAAAKAGVPANQAKECWAGSLDPAKAAGKIVTCARGTVARVEKSQTVKNAGGVGMIQYNVLATDNTVADNHIIPSVHISAADGATVLAYVNGTAAPTAAFTAGTATPAKAPQMASFSSAGPSLQAGGDLLKPDITAPGVDIFAATSPDTNNGGLYAPNSGTSMASPHIAGIAALIRGKHPDWSPTAVRSALMTSASQTDNEGDAIQRGGVDATSFDYGSGHVTPGGAFDPGLVYESGPIDWLRFGCGTGELISIGYGDLCDEYGPIDPSDLNYPSIAVGSLVGKQTITRTVTNVDDSTSTYFVKTSAPAGTKVDVSPKTLTVKPGKTATYTVTITRTNAAYGSYTHGSITWKDFNGHSVRSPIAVRPAQIAAVSEVDGTGVSGSVGLGGTVGYAGTLKATVSGIVPAAVSPLALSNPTGGTFPTAAPVENDHVKKVEVTVPSGSGAKFAVYGADYTADTDVDLYFYRKSATGALTYLGASASGGSDESAVLPGGATYVVYVDLWSSPGSAPVTVGFHSFVYGADTGALKLSPASQTVTTGQKFVVTASWSGLTAGTRYFGVVSYRDASNTALTSTAVTITT